MTEKISPEDFQRIYKVVEEKGGIVLALVFVVILFGICCNILPSMFAKSNQT